MTSQAAKDGGDSSGILKLGTVVQLYDTADMFSTTCMTTYMRNYNDKDGVETVTTVAPADYNVHHTVFNLRVEHMQDRFTLAKRVLYRGKQGLAALHTDKTHISVFREGQTVPGVGASPWRKNSLTKHRHEILHIYQRLSAFLSRTPIKLGKALTS